MSVDRETLPYRPCVGVMLVNREGKIFVGQRLDSTLEAWQMPQGGIDPGEDPLTAAIRELGEETGIAPDRLEIVERADGEFRYDLPDDLIGRVWKGRYRGQVQTWFLARFLGGDDDVDIATAHPEFRAWRWADPDDVPRLIVPFKQALYRDVLAAFRGRLAAWGRG